MTNSPINHLTSNYYILQNITPDNLLGWL